MGVLLCLWMECSLAGYNGGEDRSYRGQGG